MLTWSAIAGLILVLALAAATVAGALLPREHRARRMAEYHEQPGAVWDAITDFASLPAWMPGVKAVAEGDPESGAPRWTLTTSEGMMTVEVVELEAPRRMTSRIAGDGLAFGGTWTYEVVPVDGGTRLTITEDGWISNPLFRFFAHYVFGVNRTIDDALRGLGERFGETVMPRPAPEQA